MQKIAAYLLERRISQDLAERNAEQQTITTTIENWLSEKSAKHGEYKAEDGSDASYSVSAATVGGRSTKLYRLDERSEDGRLFRASVSSTLARESAYVFVTLEVGTASTQISPITVAPYCPKVVRRFLKLDDAWFHGFSQIKGLSYATGFEEGEQLAEEILDEKRTIPIVVVSDVDGSAALPSLDENLAFDLAGLANVYHADQDACWALTDQLQRRLSCYLGAVRVYWPRLRRDDSPYRHYLWTASRLISLDEDSERAKQRFRGQIRRLVMRASAASVVRPKEIDEIRNAAEKAGLADLKARANSLEDFQGLAEDFARNNDKLRAENSDLLDEVSALQSQLAQAEANNDSLKFHLKSANIAVSNDIDLVEPDQGADETEEGPLPGEIRFYKKHYSSPRHDILIVVGDCGHNAWQGAAKADKAKKGIARLERKEPDSWKSVQHCSQCEGGGLWRVDW